jgi:hypothetical protein
VEEQGQTFVGEPHGGPGSIERLVLRSHSLVSSRLRWCSLALVRTPARRQQIYARGQFPREILHYPQFAHATKNAAPLAPELAGSDSMMTCLTHSPRHADQASENRNAPTTGETHGNHQAVWLQTKLIAVSSKLPLPTSHHPLLHHP